MRWFVLPPVAKRRMIGGPVKKYNYPNFTKDADDTYIYYLVWKYSFLLAALFSVLYWVSYAYHTSFNFYFFTVDVWHYNWLAKVFAWHPERGHLISHSFVLAMICSYGLVVTPLLLVVVIPYAWLLFRANIDLDAYDLLSWNQAFVEKKRGNPDELLTAYRKNLRICVIGLFGSSGLPEFFLHNQISLEKSEILFVAFLGFCTWIYPVGMYSIVACCATYRQLKAHRGPFFVSKSTTV